MNIWPQRIIAVRSGQPDECDDKVRRVVSQFGADLIVAPFALDSETGMLALADIGYDALARHRAVLLRVTKEQHVGRIGDEPVLRLATISYPRQSSRETAIRPDGAGELLDEVVHEVCSIEGLLLYELR